MKWWALAKQFPKYALVLGIIISSTALFACWWLFRSRPKSPEQRQDDAARRAAIARNAVKAETLVDYLFLADDDLYEAKEGTLLFKNWLHGDHPLRLFYDAKTKRILGQYKEGFARYAFDGTREAAMMMANQPEFYDGFKHIVFAKQKNVWSAEVDWQNFCFTNERQVTTINSFYEGNFADNIQLLTNKTLVVRSLNNLLRVDLANGNVKPVRIPLKDIAKRRSPDNRWIVGTMPGQFFCYNVDTDEGKTIPIRRDGISDFLWLNNDRCICLANGKFIVAYERLSHTLNEVTTLPFQCFKIGEPSPDGRFIFSAGGIDGRDGTLVDLEEKTANRVNGGAGITWVSKDTFSFSRDILDSDLRGTWTQKVGGSEKRMSSEPCLASNGGLKLTVISPAKLLVLVTRPGLNILELDGSSWLQPVQCHHTIRRVLTIWTFH